MQNETNNTLDVEDVPRIEPCKHMENNISALSDGSLRGLALWYTQIHAAYCPHCGPALRALRALRARLGLLRQTTATQPKATLTEDRLAAVQKAMEAADDAPRS
jgi:hypothetical protein